MSSISIFLIALFACRHLVLIKTEIASSTHTHNSKAPKLSRKYNLWEIIGMQIQNKMEKLGGSVSCYQSKRRVSCERRATLPNVILNV